MKAAWYTKKWVIVLLHAGAWVFFFSLTYLLRSPERHSSDKPPENAHNGFYFSLIMDVFWLGFFYFNALVLLPRFIYKKSNGNLRFGKSAPCCFYC